MRILAILRGNPATRLAVQHHLLPSWVEEMVLLQSTSSVRGSTIVGRPVSEFRVLFFWMTVSSGRNQPSAEWVGDWVNPNGCTAFQNPGFSPPVVKDAVFITWVLWSLAAILNTRATETERMVARAGQTRSELVAEVLWLVERGKGLWNVRLKK